MKVAKNGFYYEIYKDKPNRYHLQLKDLRASFFSEIINENNNTRSLFATLDRLTNPLWPISVANTISVPAHHIFALSQVPYTHLPLTYHPLN